MASGRCTSLPVPSENNNGTGIAAADVALHGDEPLGVFPGDLSRSHDLFNRGQLTQRHRQATRRRHQDVADGLGIATALRDITDRNVETGNSLEDLPGGLAAHSGADDLLDILNVDAMPMAMARPPRDIRLAGIPTTRVRIKAKNTENGMAMATTRLGRSPPMNTSRTNATSTMPCTSGQWHGIGREGA